jgi:hypothetical protein
MVTRRATLRVMACLPRRRRNLMISARKGAGPRPGTRCQITVKRTRGLGIAAPFAQALNPHHPYRSIESNSHHIANSHRVTCARHALPIHTDEARGSDRGSGGPRAHHAGMPKPLIDALTVAVSGLCAQDGSLAPCSSCCLSAASLANGELGSGCLSRPPDPLPNGLA